MTSLNLRLMRLHVGTSSWCAALHKQLWLLLISIKGNLIKEKYLSQENACYEMLVIRRLLFCSRMDLCCVFLKGNTFCYIMLHNIIPWCTEQPTQSGIFKSYKHIIWDHFPTVMLSFRDSSEWLNSCRSGITDFMLEEEDKTRLSCGAAQRSQRAVTLYRLKLMTCHRNPCMYRNVCARLHLKKTVNPVCEKWHCELSISAGISPVCGPFPCCISPLIKSTCLVC